MTDAKIALALRKENGGVATNNLADQIRAMEAQYQLAMPRGAEATQLVRDALTALRMTKNLAKCEATSVMGGLMTCAQLGLRPGVLGHAWLLPFYSKKERGYQAQLVIGYQGLIELAHRSGGISSIIARTAYQNDEFWYDYGIADNLVHKPCMSGDPGAPSHYYAIVKYTNGGYAFWVMTHDQMERHRDEHATAKTREGKVFGPWVDHFEAMAHKTVVRALAKYMPKSTQLAHALAADEKVRVDLSPDIQPAEASQYPPEDDGSIGGDVIEADSEIEWPEAATPGGEA